MAPRGLLVDFGGVLTTDVFAAFAAFCRARGLDPHTIRDLFRADPDARRLLEDLETGRVDERGFEQGFAARLGVPPDGLIAALFGGVEADGDMLAAVRAARDQGIVTGLLSNSWGSATDYAPLADLFDAQVISHEEGMRKPDPRIYAIAAERMGLPPAEIAFVDDLGFNLKPASEQGMTTILHTGAAATIAALEDALGLSLSPR